MQKRLGASKVVVFDTSRHFHLQYKYAKQETRRSQFYYEGVMKNGTKKGLEKSL